MKNDNNNNINNDNDNNNELIAYLSTSTTRVQDKR